MFLTPDHLKKIAIGRPSMAAINAIVVAQNEYGERFGLDLPHRLAQWVANLAVESGNFTAFEEKLNYTAKRLTQVWPSRFPTLASAQPYAGNPEALANKVYARKELGNTSKGDGWRFRGRGPKQITGKANYAAFTRWARRLFPDCPDFVADPDAVLLNPWAGLSAIWFWDERKLNKLADEGDAENIRQIINGGFNGWTDVLRYLGRASLVFLGRPANSLEEFQKENRLKVDGVVGPKTRAELHADLLKLVSPAERPKTAAKAPVVVKETVEKEVEKPVEVPVPQAVPDPALDKPFYKDPDFIERVATPSTMGTIGSFFSGLDWVKIIAIAGLILAVSIAFYVINRARKQKKQEEAVQKIEASADRKRTAAGLV